LLFFLHCIAAQMCGTYLTRSTSDTLSGTQKGTMATQQSLQTTWCCKL